MYILYVNSNLNLTTIIACYIKSYYFYVYILFSGHGSSIFIWTNHYGPYVGVLGVVVLDILLLRSVRTVQAWRVFVLLGSQQSSMSLLGSHHLN